MAYPDRKFTSTPDALNGHPSAKNFGEDRLVVGVLCQYEQRLHDWHLFA